MILIQSTDPRLLSNAWLVGDRPGGSAVLIDSGAPMEPLTRALELNRLTLRHLFCTHHHGDHIQHNAAFRERFGCRVHGHRAQAALYGELDEQLEGGECFEAGDLRIEALPLPGHTVGGLGFLVNGAHVFTGDTLFRGSVGGTCGSGHATCEDLRNSVMEVLMMLPDATEVHPGHEESTTIAREWSENPFILAWRGERPTEDRSCTAFGRAATLLVEGRDYDGGTKCWVRFEPDGPHDLVPGSRVLRSE